MTVSRRVAQKCLKQGLYPCALPSAFNVVTSSRGNLALQRAVSNSVMASVQKKNFSALSPAMIKLAEGLKTEIEYEKENYKQDDDCKVSVLPKGWKLEEKEGDVTLTLVKEFGDKECRIEWQLANALDDEPLDEDYESQEEPEDRSPATDFTITIQSDGGEKGMSLYCNTYGSMAEEEDADVKPVPFAIGAVKSWTEKSERDSPTSYNGPEYEDFPVPLQQALNEYLIELGISETMIHFIDAAAVDKEQREYIRWLNNMKSLIG